MNDFEMPTSTPNLYASLAPTKAQYERVNALCATPRDLFELRGELMSLNLVYEGKNPAFDSDDWADLGAAIDALRLAIAAIPAEGKEQLWVKRCALADAQPRLAINALLPALAAASLKADATRLYGCKVPASVRSCAIP